MNTCLQIMTPTYETLEIVSLFDGISVAQSAIAEYTKNYRYYGYEIEGGAIKVALDNFPNMIPCGDVRERKPSHKIDLLIGGSPCQGFSVNGLRKGFNHPESILFFEYLKTLDQLNPTYYILENVENDFIHQYLGDGHLIDSNCFVPQNRRRMFWTNIPLIGSLRESSITIDDICDFDGYTRYYEYPFLYKYPDPQWDSYADRHPTSKKHPQSSRIFKREGKIGTLTRGGAHSIRIYTKDGRIRNLHQIELERFQGLPDGYTKTLSFTKSGNAIGNAFTKPVIQYILEQWLNPDRNPKE